MHLWMDVQFSSHPRLTDDPGNTRNESGGHPAGHAQGLCALPEDKGQGHYHPSSKSIVPQDQSVACPSPLAAGTLSSHSHPATQHRALCEGTVCVVPYFHSASAKCFHMAYHKYIIMSNSSVKHFIQVILINGGSDIPERCPGHGMSKHSTIAPRADRVSDVPEGLWSRQFHQQVNT